MSVLGVIGSKADPRARLVVWTLRLSMPLPSATRPVSDRSQSWSPM